MDEILRFTLFYIVGFTLQGQKTEICKMQKRKNRDLSGDTNIKRGRK